MQRSMLNIAVYIDMENMTATDFKLDEVMTALMQSDDSTNCVFAIKSAYGNQCVAKKQLKRQVLENNFSIVDTPNIGREKNRADLMLSLDAFETLYLEKPVIDRYCFMTSDSDFTVIADKLRKFGKEVWLVCKRKDKDRAILAKSFDKLLFVEDYCKPEEVHMDYIDRLFIQAVKNMNASKLPSNVSIANDKMRAIDPSYSVRKAGFRTFMELIASMEMKGYVKSEQLSTGENRITEILVE